MQNSAARKFRLPIIFACILFLHLCPRAQIKLDGVSVQDGSLDYTRRCRVKFIYNNDKKPDTLSYADAKSQGGSCGEILRLQFLPAKSDINDYYPIEPIDCWKLSLYKPVVKIPLLSKTNSPPLAYDGIINPNAITYFMRDTDIDHFIWKVCDHLKNEKFTEKLNVVGASVPTFAENRVLRGSDIDCYLYYNPDTLAKLVRAGDSLVICGVILHEMGHIFNMHTLHMDSTNIGSELVADKYAGRWLFAMGADSTVITKMAGLIHNVNRTAYYPARQERYNSLMDGWKMEQKKLDDHLLADSIREAGKLDTAMVLYANKRYLDVMEILRNMSMDLHFTGNRLLAEKLFGETFYKLAETDKVSWPKAIEHFDIYLALKKDADMLYKAGFASFMYKSYGKANNYFSSSILMKPSRDLTGNAYFYYGICQEYLDSLPNALAAFNHSIRVDSLKPVVYYFRAKLKMRVNPDDLTPALDDYMKAYRLLPALDGKDTLKGTIAGLTYQMYRKATQRGGKDIMMTYRDLRAMQHYNLDTIMPDFTRQMALVYSTFETNKDSLHRSNDSLIRYCSMYMQRKPWDSAKILLLSGHAWYDKYLSENGGMVALNRAAADLMNIPQNAAEFDSAAYLVSMVEIQKKEFCHLLDRYGKVKSAEYRDKIAKEICPIVKAIKKSDCFESKDKKLLRQICKD